MIIDQHPTLVNPKLEKLSAIYTQDSDGMGDGEDQYLNIETEDAGAGKYYIIKTERWAFDTIEELIKTLQMFEQKLNNNNPNKQQ